MSYSKLEENLRIKNKRAYKNEQNKIKEELKELRERIKIRLKDQKDLAIEFEMDPKEVINNLKNLKFVSSVSFGEEKIKILTKDLVFDYTARESERQSANLGPYLITYDQYLNYADPTIQRVKGTVNFGTDTNYDHFFIQNKELCMGSSGMQSQYYKFITQGRLDLAVELIWNLISMGSQSNISPYISIHDFVKALKDEGVE